MVGPRSRHASYRLFGGIFLKSRLAYLGFFDHWFNGPSPCPYRSHAGLGVLFLQHLQIF
jgi:hypothetical protein